MALAMALAGRRLKDRFRFHDIQATVLHLMRLDHELLTGQNNGRPFRLTEAAGKVIYPILA